MSQAALDAYLSGEEPESGDSAEASDDAADDAADLTPAGPSEYPAISGPRSDDMLLAASSGRTCLVRLDRTATCWGRDGGVSCWGQNNKWGQVGDGTTRAREVPKRVAGISEAIDVSLGRMSIDTKDGKRTIERAAHSCALHRDGRVSCWGGNDVGQLGDGKGDSFHCEAESVVVTEMSLRVIVHELAHVYDLQTGLAPKKAWGAVQLYFASSYPECEEGTYRGVEILADTLTHVVLPDANLHYYEYSRCEAVPDLPSDEAEEVIQDGLAGRVPDWYRENITDGAALWEAWLVRPSTAVLANLMGEFGGFCETDWIKFPLDPDRFPAAGTNPFKDGGC